MKSSLLSTLQERQFINQCTDLDALDALAHNQPITAYIGFDLTADSLHVGSLIQIMVLRWMAKLGHNPIVLLGEATTRIGDPTGKSAARPILTPRQIEDNCAGIMKVFDRLLPAPRFISNATWLNDQTSLFSYLSDFGTHFTINRMVGFDTVKTRLENHQPMSFLEFNYMLFQAIDFLKLFETQGVRLQVGGSDQWGNIVNGVELVRRKTGSEVFGLTTPLMTNMAGEKMGKTANGAVWLDPDKTSPFDFWQFWRNVEDAKVGQFLALFTEVPIVAIDHGTSVHGPGINRMKEMLATEVTRLVHGDEWAEAAHKAAITAFVHGGTEGLPLHEVRDGQTIAEVFLDIGFVKSKGEADRMAAQNGIKINDVAVGDARLSFPSGEHKVSMGKKRFAVVRTT